MAGWGENGRREALKRIGAPALAGIIAIACALAIADALRGQTLASIGAALSSAPMTAIAAAGALVAVNMVVLWFIEMLAFRDAGVGLSPRRALQTGLIGNALSLAAGLGPLSGAGARFVMFRTWGVSAQAAAATALSATLISLAGGVVLAAIGLLVDPAPIAALLAAPAMAVRAAGAAALLAAALVVAWMGLTRATIAWRGARLAAPSARGALLRLLLGALDWMLSASVFFTLLGGKPALAPFGFASSFAAAHFAGMALGAPAGLGIFDALMLHGGALTGDAAKIVAALLLYRLIAYAAPALIALAPFMRFVVRRRLAVSHAGD